MAKFKVGDRVRCIDNTGASRLILGSIYMVLEHQLEDSDEVRVIESEPGGWKERRFELVYAMPFPINAKVKCVKPFEGGRPAVGDILTVKSYSNTPPDRYGVYVYFEELPSSHSFGSNHFELIGGPSKKVEKVDVADWRLWQMSASDNTCQSCGAPKPCSYHD